MAYVKMSNAVIERVEDVINTMKRNELNAINMPEIDAYDESTFEHVRLLTWGEYKYLMPPAMPKAWCQTGDVVKVRLVLGTGSEPPVLTVRSQTKHAFPPGTAYYYNPLVVRDATYEEAYGPKAPLVREFMAAAAAREECMAKWQSVFSQLRAYMEAMPSLNKAVEGMPGLAFYLHQDDKIRLAAENVKRAKSDPEAPPVDVEAIISAAMAHRLAHGRIE